MEVNPITRSLYKELLKKAPQDVKCAKGR
jgi:hypothetical protein